MSASDPPHSPSEARLETWKAIAGFFGKDERTAKRWEAERGLPVHRLPGETRSKVYAYPSELSAWLRSAPDADPALAAARPPRPTARFVALVVFGVLALSAGWALWRARSAPGHAAALSAPQAPAHTPVPAAQDLYLKGLYDWNSRTPAGLQRAVDEFTQAIVRDPQYAEPYVGLANCYNLLREYTLMPAAQAYPRAKAAAERAVALDEHLAGGHTALAFVLAYWSWDNAAAEREFRRAIELDPRSAQAHHWHATFLEHLGRFDEALREIERARALDPNSSAVLADKGMILRLAGRTAEATQLLEQLEASDPNLLTPHQYLADVYLDRGDAKAYLAEMQRTAALLHDAAALRRVGAEGAAARRGGLAGMLQASVDDLRTGPVQAQPAYVIADLYGRLGRKAEALGYLKLAVASHDQAAAGLLVDPAFTALRGDPQFIRLEREAGLAASAPARPR